MIQRLKELGVTSDMAYAASGASILLSIAMWFLQRKDDAPHAERSGIFIGLWAPTLAILGNALTQHEVADRKGKG